MRSVHARGPDGRRFPRGHRGRCSRRSSSPASISRSAALFLTGATANLPVSRRILLSRRALVTRASTGLPVTEYPQWPTGDDRARRPRDSPCDRTAWRTRSEILHQIAQSRLRFVEVPVNIEYSAYSLGKGQRITDALTILIDLFARRLYR